MLIGITLWEFISVLLCTAFLFSKCLHRGIVCKAIILTISLVFAAILGGGSCQTCLLQDAMLMC